MTTNPRKRYHHISQALFHHGEGTYPHLRQKQLLDPQVVCHCMLIQSEWIWCKAPAPHIFVRTQLLPWHAAYCMYLLEVQWGGVLHEGLYKSTFRICCILGHKSKDCLRKTTCHLCGQTAHIYKETLIRNPRNFSPNGGNQRQSTSLSEQGA